MNRLTDILINLPDFRGNRKLENPLFRLFFELNNFSTVNENEIQSNLEKTLLPKTKIVFSKINYPLVSFNTADGVNPNSFWNAKKFIFGFNIKKQKRNNFSNEKRQRYICKTLSDNVGDYIQLSSKIKKYYLLTPEQLFSRVSGKLSIMNHAGLNIGPKLIDKSDYLKFRTLLAKFSNLYKYPTGEEWPFIISSTDEEFLNEVTDETKKRNPKFEIVYSHYHDTPLLQFDIETKLTKEEVLTILPEPYGISLEGLENFFRTVFVYTEYSNDVVMRFDLRFKTASKDFGYWLIKDGGRY